MKKFILLSIAMVIILGGCGLIEKDHPSRDVGYKMEEEKLRMNDTASTMCNIDTDCEIEYNVKHEGECVAGCFHKDSEICEDCLKSWTAIPDDCTCDSGECKLHTK